MKKVFSVFMAIVMVVSLFACFAVNSAAVTTKDSTVFKIPKTSTAPKLDGNVDSCYKQIFTMKGSQAVKSDGKPNESYPLDGNNNSARYDAAEHPNREQSDWWNCSMTGYAAWDATYLYLIVDIKNAGKLDDNPDANWAGDGIQVSVFKGTSDSGNTTDYTFAQDNGKITATMNLVNTNSNINLKKVAYDYNKYGRAPSGFIKVSDKEKGNYTYELALEWTALGIKPSDSGINFNCSVNLNDENMDPSSFCGFQITNGIYNEKDQKTKSGMAYAASMVFEGDGGNASSSNGNGNSNSNGNGNSNTTKPDNNNTTKPDNNNTPTPDNNTTEEESEVVKAARTALEAAETKMADLENNTSYEESAKADVVAAYEEFKAALNAETIDETALAAAQKALEDAYAALTGSTTPDNNKKDNDKKDDDKKDDNKQEDTNKGGSLVWLWIVIGVVVVLAAAFCIVYFAVCKGDMNKFKALFSKKK